MARLDACIGIAILGQLTAPQANLQWKILVGSSNMLAENFVPLHQVGLLAHFGKMSGKTGTATHRKKEYRDVISMIP